MKHNFLLAIFIFQLMFYSAGFNQSLAQEVNIKQHDLSGTWKVFSKNTMTFHEYRPVGRSTSVRFNLALQDQVDGWLEVMAPHGSSFLINGKYYGMVDKKLVIELDSLLSASNRNVFDFTVYSSAGLNHINLSTVFHERVSDNGEGSFNRKSRNGFMDFYVLASIIILMFMGFLSRKFPRDTNDYFSFLRSISFKNREETLISSRPFNRTNVLFIILDSVLIGFLIVSMVHLASGHVYFPFIRRQMDFLELLAGWIAYSAIVFLYIVAKYMVIIVFNNLFRLGEFRYIQHFNSLRFSIGTFLLIFLLTTFTYLTFRTEGLHAYFIFTRILVFLLLLRILVLFFKLRDFTSFRNFHLFSYLCGTEIIPFIILYKLVLG